MVGDVRKDLTSRQDESTHSAGMWRRAWPTPERVYGEDHKLAIEI